MRHYFKASSADHQYYDAYEIGGHHTRTVYFIGAYNGKPLYFKRFITQLERKGYRIIYLQPATFVLDVANPKNLANAIAQAVEFIRDDSQKTGHTVSGLIGVSLGSYIGLNIITRIPFTKFVVVAGGSPLLEVLAKSKLFKRSRRKIEALGNHSAVHTQWAPFDNYYKKAKLHGTNVLFLISRDDNLITKDNFQKFLGEFTQTGAKMQVRESTGLSHTWQALSINWRTKQIEHFLN